VRWCKELVEQLTATHQEVADARAKVLADADAFERLRVEQDRLVGTVDELRDELEAIDQERDVTMRLSEEREEQARASQGNLAGKIHLLFPLDCRFLRRGVFDFPS
jgi:hypothetical protein